jgi:hypothetical protein
LILTAQPIRIFSSSDCLIASAIGFHRIALCVCAFQQFVCNFLELH